MIQREREREREREKEGVMDRGRGEWRVGKEKKMASGEKKID